MAFSSPLFLFLFLPVILVLHFCLGRRFRNLLLLVASLVFYAWGEKQFTLILIGSIVVNYLIAWFIDRAIQKPDQNKGQSQNTQQAQAKSLLVLGIVLNLGLLVILKYNAFIVDNINWLFNFAHLISIHISTPVLHLPIGISFFTFSAISFLVDLYKKEAPFDKNPINTALYIAFFPKLLAGPIVRYHDVVAQIKERKPDLDKFADGLKRLIIGLGKKVLIADTLAVVVNQIYAIPAGQLTTGLSWLGVLCFTLQIYFDFSGYSDIAIGIGKMAGFDFMENFNYPYISLSIRDFWRRWHISLSSFLRDYLYIPLGGNRKGIFRVYLNLLIVFLLCGLWHGAAWAFLAWGLWHGIFMVLERTRAGKVMERTWFPLQWLYAFLVIVIGWAIFRSGSVSYSLGILKAMFGLAPDNGQISNLGLYLNSLVITALAAAAVFSFPVMPALERLKNALFRRSQFSQPTIQNILTVSHSLVLLVFYGSILVLSIMSVSGSTNIPFIYFQF